MIRRFSACLLLAASLAAPAAAGDKVRPTLTPEAKDGLQTTQDNITKMKIKTTQQPTFTPQPFNGPPAVPPPPTPSVN